MIVEKLSNTLEYFQNKQLKQNIICSWTNKLAKLTSGTKISVLNFIRFSNLRFLRIEMNAMKLSEI